MPHSSKLRVYIFPLIIIFVTLFLCFKNYTPGTYLIGWDSVHPEFNFSLNFSRMISHVWSGEQGVGAIAAHSDTSDLPRIIFLWLSSFVLPASFLRYFYIFLCLILGPLGMYFFLTYVFQKEKASSWTGAAAFLGALFYLLNLSTLQNFYVPLEMFPTAFAFIPWLFYAGIKFLREGSKRNLLFFALFSILSSAMAYAATLWYATFAGLFLFLVSYALFSSVRKIKIKRVLVLGAVALFLNLYWILPNFYSIANQSATISNSNINRLFSPEAFLRNRDYGDFKDILLQKNFLFGWRNFDFQNNQFVDLLGVWIKYLSNPFVLVTGYVLAGISMLGFFLGTLKREKVSLALIPTLVFALFFLININPPTGGLFAYFYNNFRIFSEGFRMPFTKFSILYQFAASFYFGYFAFILMTLKPKFLAIFKSIFFLGILLALVYFMLPAFSGQLIGSNVRRQFPEEYTRLFNWFNSNPEGRIALFPINSKYGWEYRSWGYEGSGFLTYGISDPILYRDFDRWSSANEDFFNQASFALYSNDSQGLITTLKKYQIKYLLLDESIINPGGTPDILKTPALKAIFAASGIRQAVKFGFLTVYETNFGGEVVAPVTATSTSTDLLYSAVDLIYARYGDYINTAPVNPIRKSPALPSTSPVVSENFLVNRGFSGAYNCDLEKAGNVFKSNSSSGILYRAENGGVSCDYLPYPSLKYNQAYILRVVGENHEGRSLKIYLFNEVTQVPELEEILPSGKFDQTYFIYPKSNLAGSGYILNLETRSFGRIPSENLLSKVEFYMGENFTSASQGEALQNNIKIVNVQKYGTWAYKFDVQGSGLIQLGQGYGNGWITSPFLQHVKVNSWANGWMVPAGVYTIYIFYWPQLLEWGGMAIGITTLLLIACRVLSRNSPKSTHRG